jgi:peptide deformylase
VEALDRVGTKVEIDAEGLSAIVLQHEIDHLEGILFIDRLSRLKRELVKRKLKKKIEAQDGAL